ncbi:sensor histidine kinase [uncultured Robinsoniella sp.]|uniref:sensor histidine kinase n=1 Tax=uncultured Robinsoniella sp. TaxID=904190 RepID=UPI00374F44EF
MKRKLSYSRKIFIVFTGLSIIFVLILSGVFYARSYIDNKERAQAQFKDIVERTALSLEREIDSLDMISCQVFGNKTIQRQLFYASQDGESGINYFEQNPEAKMEVQEVLWSFNSPRKAIANLSIIYPNTFIGLLEIPDMKDINREWNKGTFEDWEGDYKILPTHEDPFVLYGEKDKITVSLLRKQTLSFYGQQEFGVIEVQQSYEKIEDICRQNYNQDEMMLYVIDDNGDVVFPYRETAGAEVNITQFIKEKPADTLISGEQRNVGVGIYHKLSNAPWNVVMVQNNARFLDPILGSLRWILILGISMVLLVIFAVYMVTQQMMNPIVKLRLSLESEEVRRTLNFSDLKTEIDEINLLQEAFTKMIRHIKESTELMSVMRENELELKISALQAQMNPHFLYNSLAAIGAAGMEDGSFKTQMMCVELSELLRYSGSDTERKVDIQSELNNLKSYLSCMKWRYEDNLHYRIQVDGKTDVDFIPKLTFQPLVENAFVHGFSKILPPYEIIVTCNISESGWIFEMKDNGTGIDEEKRNKIHGAISDIDHIFAMSKEYINLRVENMAVLNIYIRLKKEYGEKIQFILLDNEDSPGTIVRIEVKR